MFVEQRFSCGPLELNVATGPPAGPPLLLIHGVLRCWHDFTTLLPTLASRWQVYAVDLRGHGSSQWADGAYVVADYVRDIVALVQTHFAQRNVLVYGHSLGALVATGVAAALPESVDAIVLEDPPFRVLGADIERSPFFAQFAGAYKLVQRKLSWEHFLRDLAELPVSMPGTSQSVRLGTVRDAASLRFAARSLFRCDPEVLAPLVAGRWLQGYECDALLSDVRCPTLLLQADVKVGGMLADHEAEDAARLLADCARIRLPGVGHLVHAQQPAATLDWVTNFLNSLPND